MKVLLIYLVFLVIPTFTYGATVVDLPSGGSTNIGGVRVNCGGPSSGSFRCSTSVSCSPNGGCEVLGAGATEWAARLALYGQCNSLGNDFYYHDTCEKALIRAECR